MAANFGIWTGRGLCAYCSVERAATGMGTMVTTSKNWRNLGSSRVASVAMDDADNILKFESDYRFMRWMRFRRMFR